jgi:hypothetical protein
MRFSIFSVLDEIYDLHLYSVVIRTWFPDYFNKIYGIVQSSWIRCKDAFVRLSSNIIVLKTYRIVPQVFVFIILVLKFLFFFQANKIKSCFIKVCTKEQNNTITIPILYVTSVWSQYTCISILFFSVNALITLYVWKYAVHIVPLCFN